MTEQTLPVPATDNLRTLTHVTYALFALGLVTMGLFEVVAVVLHSRDNLCLAL